MIEGADTVLLLASVDECMSEVGELASVDVFVTPDVVAMEDEEACSQTLSVSTMYLKLNVP